MSSSVFNGVNLANRLRLHPGLFFHLVKIPLLAADHETFGDGFQFFPAGADLFGLGGGDLIVGGGGGDDLQEVGKFLDDLIGGGNQEMRMRRVLGIEDEKAARALAEPLDEPDVAGALVKCLDAVQRVFNAAAAVVGRLRPLVNHGRGEFEVGGDFLGRLLVEDFVEQFMGFHGVKMGKCGRLGKREAWPDRGLSQSAAHGQPMTRWYKKMSADESGTRAASWDHCDPICGGRTILIEPA